MIIIIIIIIIIIEYNFVGRWARHSYNKKNSNCARKTAYNGIPSHTVNECQPVAEYRQMAINPTSSSVGLKTTKSSRKEAEVMAVLCK